MTHGVNTQRKFGEADHYHVAYMVQDGELQPMLLTDAQIIVARGRADTNPEDVPAISWWRSAMLRWAL